MTSFNCHAIILKSINYKDKDKIYTLITDTHGKIGVVARGVRKISSKRAGNLDSLNYLSLKIVEYKNDIKNIEEVVVLDSFKNIKSDYNLILKAYYFAEILNKNTEESFCDLRVFKLFKKSLQMLDCKKFNINLVQLFYETHLLKELGYFPKLPIDSVICDNLKNILDINLNKVNLNSIKKTSDFLSAHIKDNLNYSLKSIMM